MLAATLIATPVGAAERVLRVAVGDWIPGLGNPYASAMNGTVHPFAGMFDALTFLAGDGTAQPHLALSWHTESPTRWVFQLRTGVVFANGEPLDAAAVVAMFDWLKRPEAQRFIMAGEVKGIVTAQALDRLTVAITTATPDVVLPKRLSLLQVVPPAYWSKVGPDAFAQAPIGSGPFILKTWGRDRGRYIVERNPAAWRPALGLDRVEYIVLPDGARRAQALATFEAEIAFNIDFEGMDQLKGQGIPTVIRQMPVVTALAMPNNRPGSALKDIRVRQALNYAVDRAAIARIIMRDTATPNGQGVVPGVFGYAAAVAPYPYDPGRARALLAEAGYAKGLSLTASVIAKASVEGEAIYQRVTQDLAAVGVTLSVRNTSGADWVRMWVSGDWRGADMLSAVWNGATTMDAARAVEPFTCAKPGAFFCAPEIDKLIAESDLTFDSGARERQLQDILAKFHDQAPSLYLFPQPELIGISPRVANVQYRGRYLDWSILSVKP